LSVHQALCTNDSPIETEVWNADEKNIGKQTTFDTPPMYASNYLDSQTI
jgi:hypothetical protein